MSTHILSVTKGKNKILKGATLTISVKDGVSKTYHKYSEYQTVRNLLKSLPSKADPASRIHLIRENAIAYIKDYRAASKSINYYYTFTTKIKDKEYTEIYTSRSPLIGLNKLEIYSSYVSSILDKIHSERRNQKLKTANLSVSSRGLLNGNKRWHEEHQSYYGKNNTGYVRATKGQILHLLNVQRTYLVFEDKKPITTEHHVGIEMEFWCKKNKTELGLLLLPYSKYVTLKSDSSIEVPEEEIKNGGISHELVVCVPESMMTEVVTGVSNVLKSIKCQVNKSCGLHTHLDMRSRNHETCFSQLVSAQNILYQMQPKSRADNRYCKKVETKNFKEAENSYDRYMGINSHSFRKYKTIEIRMHAGTVDSVKILNWINILLRIINKPDTILRAPTKVEHFVNRFDLPDDLSSFINERIAKFAADGEAETGAA